MLLIAMDLKTMAFIAMCLTFILSIFLALMRQGSRYVQGPNYWALGSFSICFGMAVLFFGFYSTQWMLVFVPVFIIAGVGLFINGLQAFNNKAPDRRIPLLLGLLLGSVDWFLVLFQHDLRMATIFNAVLFAIVYFIAGCMLLRPADKGLAFIYRMNASLFYFMAIFMVFRVYAALIAGPEVFLAESEWVVNQLTFMAFFIQQLSTTLSLTLMLHYRNMQLLRDQITVDELTGALKSHGLQNAGARVLANCLRNDEIMSILMINVDRLHAINKKNGGELGDEILRELSRLIREIARPNDVIGRSGGDALCMLLPNTSEQLAMDMAEQIRRDIELLLIVAGDQHTFVTLSIGVSHSEYAGLDYQHMLAAAESAMYSARESGNKVVAHSYIHQIS
jgi:diguanylate cyclase (GGDEF)-like protein